jgi:hypothetical protein
VAVATQDREIPILMGKHRVPLAVFAVLPQIISEHRLVFRGNPGSPVIWRTKEQRDARCSFAVFRVFLLEESNIAKPVLPAGNGFNASSDAIRIPEMLP